MMEERKLFIGLILLGMCLAGSVPAAVIRPAIISSADTNPYSSATIDKLVDNSGLTPAVNTGDSLAAALGAIHANTGVFESWVTNANAPDYFGVNPPPPTIVFDLTGGGDIHVGTFILWQYQNDGGGGNHVGNHARTIELRFNTEAEGSTDFTGPVTVVTAKPVLTGEDNVAQPFAVEATCRYVQIRVTDNHFGDPDGLGVDPAVGGDRVGLGEVRFATDAWLEPENYSKAYGPDVTQVEGAQPELVDVTFSWKTGRIPDPADANNIIADPAIVKHVLSVSNGSLTDPNVYFLAEISADGPEASYGPVALNRSRTYYWRVDEVTDANTIVGDVWSFVTLTADPSITAGPDHQYVNTGQAATFEVTAVNPFTEDSSGLSYEWHKVDAGGDTVVGDDAPTYTTPEAAAEDNGTGYYCIVSIAEPPVEASVTSQTAYLIVKQRIAYWPFDGTFENIDDPSGATDGTPQSEPQFSDETIIPGGQALALDGVDDYVTVDNDALAWSPSASFSVTLWARVSGGGYRAAISNRHEPPTQGFILYAQGNNAWGFWAGIGAGWGGVGGPAVTANEWTHLALTFEPTGIAGDNVVGIGRLYVNGVQYENASLMMHPKEPGTSPLFIGAGQNENPANFFFNGLIDDVRIYNYALTQEEVATQYTDIVGPACIYGNPPFDVTGPDGEPDCAVDLLDFAEFASHWLEHGFFPYRPQ